jgi:predicted transcriptional regulator
MINRLMEKTQLNDRERDQLKVLLTEESTLVLTHQQLLAHLLQKSSLNPDEQNALRGLIQRALPTPIATYINNN